MPRLLYDCLILCATPLVFLYFAWRGRREPNYRRHWAERLGFWQLPQYKTIQNYEWIHAASMGEIESAKILIQHRLNNIINNNINNNLLIITVFTPTGRVHAEKIFADYIQNQQIIIKYLPFDSQIFLKILFRKFKKNKIKITRFWLIETELWVNLLDILAENHTDMLIASGRLGENPEKKYKILPSLARLRKTLAHFRVIAVQTEIDAIRYQALGASAKQLSIMGNLKYDQQPPSKNLYLFQKLIAPRWLAASTHAGEEKLVLAAHKHLQKKYPSAQLCLAPRHPQRFAEVETLLSKRLDSHQYQKRSDQKIISSEISVFLLDTLGELVGVYADFAANCGVVFMGGTAIPIGGHNILEATRQGCVVLLGKYVKTIQTEVNQLSDIQAILPLNLDLNDRNASFTQQAELLAEKISELWENQAYCIEYGTRAKQWTDTQQGSLARLLTLAFEQKI